jgi:hypothetical protein
MVLKEADSPEELTIRPKRIACTDYEHVIDSWSLEPEWGLKFRGTGGNEEVWMNGVGFWIEQENEGLAGIGRLNEVPVCVYLASPEGTQHVLLPEQGPKMTTLMGISDD